MPKENDDHRQSNLDSDVWEIIVREAERLRERVDGDRLRELLSCVRTDGGPANFEEAADIFLPRHSRKSPRVARSIFVRLSEELCPSEYAEALQRCKETPSPHLIRALQANASSRTKILVDASRSMTVREKALAKEKAGSSSWPDEEEVAYLLEIVDQHPLPPGRNGSGYPDYAYLADALNWKFHYGSPVRDARSCQTKVYCERKRKREKDTSVQPVRDVKEWPQAEVTKLARILASPDAFHQLGTRKGHPDYEKIGAAIGRTAKTVEYMTRRILNDPDERRRLEESLGIALPEPKRTIDWDEVGPRFIELCGEHVHPEGSQHAGKPDFPAIARVLAVEFPGHDFKPSNLSLRYSKIRERH